MRVSCDSARPPAIGENLAFIWTHSGARPLPLLTHGVTTTPRARAEHLGYQLDEFFLRAPGMTSSRLRSILRARGIRGVLFAPDTAPPLPRVSFNVAGFAAVLLGSSLLNRGLARVQFDHFESSSNSRCAGVRKAGYRRQHFSFHRPSTQEPRGGSALAA